MALDGVVLTRNERVLKGIFWEYVYKQFPEICGADSVRVHSDWSISINRDDFTQVGEPLFGPKHPSARFIELLSGLCTGTIDFNIDHEFDPVDIESGEKVIGVLNDYKIQQLKCLGESMFSHEKAGLPKFSNEQSLYKWLQSKTVKEANLFMKKARRIGEQADLLSEIFWLGVGDVIPAAQKFGALGAREEWKIVSVPSVVDGLIDEANSDD